MGNPGWDGSMTGIGGIAALAHIAGSCCAPLDMYGIVGHIGNAPGIAGK